MTIIKNHFEVFLVTSKSREMALSSQSWVIFNKGQFTHICQLNVSCGQDSVSGIVQLRPRNFVSYFTVNSKKLVSPKLYCHSKFL
jgi:hypothetical protein